MVGCVELDGTQVGDEDRGVVRIGLDQIVGHLAEEVQAAQYVHHRAQNEARQLHEEGHALGGIVHGVAAAALEDLLHDLLVEGVQRGLRAELLEGQRLLAVVVELLLHHEGQRQLVSLVEPHALDEVVHLRAQRHRLDQRAGHAVEDGVAVRMIQSCVLLLQKRVQRRQIHGLLDEGLVVRAVRVKIGYEAVHGIRVPHQRRVKAIPDPLFLLLQCISSFPQVPFYPLLEYIITKRKKYPSFCAISEGFPSNLS